MAQTNAKPCVAIVVLNWRGAADTIECLESLLAIRGVDHRIFVCDNGSNDGSIEKIAAWAQGLARPLLDGPPWRALQLVPASAFPVACRIVLPDSSPLLGDPPLTIVDVGSNLGFAGGNNAGLRMALADDRFTHFWLLNNDTVAAPDALVELVKRMARDPRIGLCGSRVMQYTAPDEVQVAGGARFDWTRVAGAPIRDIALGESDVEARMDYVYGASMLASRAFLSQIGLLGEDYFLYFEEMDWSVRMAGIFRLGYAAASVIYHKEGASAGSRSTARPSDLSLRYMTANRLVFTRRHARQRLLRLHGILLFESLVYVKRRDLRAAAILIRTLFSDAVRRPRRTERLAS